MFLQLKLQDTEERNRGKNCEMENLLCSWIRKTNIVKMAILLVATVLPNSRPYNLQ